jgi:hypothetical protein
LKGEFFLAGLGNCKLVITHGGVDNPKLGALPTGGHDGRVTAGDGICDDAGNLV